MTKLILAISPDKSLLDQISAHLQEGGRFQVFGVTSGKEALTLAAKQTFHIAILDAEANDLPFLPLTRELIGLIPSLKLLIYPPNNNVHHPLLNGVVANGFLNKPFFGPEVNEKISRTLNENNTHELVDGEHNLARLWVENPESGLHQLEQLLASTSASAGLLLIHGRVIAASGALGDESSQNVVNFLTRYWTNIQAGELFRYLKMDNEAKNYLVYATPLFTNVAFALIYHTNISLIEIRGEVTSIRDALLNRYANTSALRSEFMPAGKEFPTGDDMPLVTTVAPLVDEKEEVPTEENEATDPVIYEFVDENQTPVDSSAVITIEPTEITSSTNEESASADEELEEDDQLGLNDTELNQLDSIMSQIDIPEPEAEEVQPGLSEEELANLDSLLADMPAPDPEAESSTEPVSTPEPLSEWLAPGIKETPVEPENHSEIQPPAQPGNTHPLTSAELVTQKEEITAPLPALPEEPHHQPAENFPNFNFLLPWEKETANDETAEFDQPPVVPVPAELAEEQSNETVYSNPDAILFEYQILLVPGNPQQFITHDLANLLNRQFPRLHQSSGWQCTHLSIRPLYLQWSALLPMNSSLADMIQEIKERTEIQIFATSPSLLKTHANGKFWAPGYFAISGSQPFSNRLINDYLSFFRQTFPNQKPG